MELGQDVQKQVDALFVDYDHPSSPGCALGIALNGELVCSRGYGLADLEHGVPITPDTVFHLASVSKQFTAACIALLEEAGELSIDDEVRRYLSWLPEYPHVLRLQHLLTMTDGLEDVYEVAFLIKGVPEDRGFTQEEAVGIVRAADWLKFAPGERWSYSNTAYFLLARIVEQISGQPFAGFVQEQLFDPLAMKRTFVRTDRRAIIPNRANSYTRAGYIHYKDPKSAMDPRFYHHVDPMEVNGADQVWSTVNDLFLWDQNFYYNVLGRGCPGLMERMAVPAVLNDGRPSPYGYGQFITERNGLKVVSHEGGSPGINTVIYRIPDKRLSIICLANINDFLMAELRRHGMDIYEKIAGMVLKELEGKPAEPAEQATHLEPVPVSCNPLPSVEQQDAVGKYEDPETSHIWEVALGPSGLMVKENFREEFSLMPAGDGGSREPVFHAAGKELRCVFCRDGEAHRGPFTRIAVQDGKGGQRRTFRRFLALPLAMDVLQEYEGVYACQRLKTAYRVVARETGVQLQNTDLHNDALDVVFAPTIQDMFMAQYPPFLEWYVIHFRRAQGRITAFVFRDEVPGRDNWVFERND